MASQYNLNLKATLDTRQVQQELQKLRAAQMATYTDGSGPAGSSQMGLSHMQKIEVQLTKLNQTIVNLQKSIDALNRKTGTPAGPYSGKMPSTNAGGVPIAASPETNKLLKKFSDNVAASQAQLLSMHPGRSRDVALEALRGIGINGNDYANIAQSKVLDKHIARQSRQLASLIGGQIIGGAGDLATSFGYNKTGAWMSGIGQGITAGGGAGFAASMVGAGAAAGPIGIVVGLAAAAASVASALKQLEEAAKKTAEQQEKIAESLRESARGQNVQRYGAWQQLRADQVRKENNLVVAQERESYFKEQLEKARRSYFGLQNPEDFERKTREEAAKKKAEQVTRTIVATPGTAGGGSYSYTTVSDKYSDEEKQKIDEAANKAIEAQQKKVQAAKRELDAAEQNYNLWKDVADDLKKSKEEADKAQRDRRNAEYAKRRQSYEEALSFAEQQTWNDRELNTKALSFSILNNKQLGPAQKFNQIVEELDKLRGKRNGLLGEAYQLNKDIKDAEKNWSSEGAALDSAALADMRKRRDWKLSEAASVGEQASSLEAALMHIRTQLTKPDLSHVTSLAQYGFNMGEKDDTVERMDKYYTRSINLQEQIKNKLQEGIATEARYSE